MPVFSRFQGFDPASLGLSALSGVASMFGGSGLTPEQKRAMHMQQQIAARLYNYGTGVPGSAPDERAALAQQQAMLGEDQLNQRNQLLATMGVNQGQNGLGDALLNLGSLQVAQRMGVDQTHLLNALAQRRQALLDAANVSNSAANLSAQATPNPLPGYLGQLSSALAYQQAYKKQKGAGAGGAGVTALGGGSKIPAEGGHVPGADFSPAPRPFSGVEPGWWNLANTLTGSGFGQAPNAYNMAQSAGGVAAPGNEALGGANGNANRMRQPAFGTFGGLPAAIRQFVLPNGLRFG